MQLNCKVKQLQYPNNYYKILQIIIQGVHKVLLQLKKVITKAVNEISYMNLF